MRIIILALIFLFVSCAEKTEQHKVLDEKTFVEIYCDVVLKTDFLKEEQKQAFVDSILTNYHVSRETFENTTQQYDKNPKKWKSVFEKIVAELEKRLELLENPNRPDTTKTKKNQNLDKPNIKN